MDRGYRYGFKAGVKTRMFNLQPAGELKLEVGTGNRLHPVRSKSLPLLFKHPKHALPKAEQTTA